MRAFNEGGKRLEHDYLTEVTAAKVLTWRLQATVLGTVSGPRHILKRVKFL